MKLQLPKIDYVKNIVTPYDIADNPAHVWGYTQCLHESWPDLAKVCVQMGPQYWIKDPRAGWCSYGDKQVAKRELFNAHGDAMGCRATRKACTEFVDHGVASFHGKVLLPGAEEFCRLDGKPVLNTWEDRRLPGDTDDIAEALPILHMIARNLCGENLNTIDELTMAVNDKEGSFGYLMHYLASLYQHPGRHIGTTVFLITGQGMGKGTTVSAIESVLGGYVSYVNDAELRRGWNSCIDGALLSVWDEFKATRGDGLYTKIKQYVGTDTLTIARKGLEAITVPNISNHLFFTNKDYPIFIDEDDRRISFIGGSRDVELKKLSSKVFRILQTGGNESKKLLSGFAAFLTSVSIDQQMIAEPLVNAYRSEIINTSRSTVENWFAQEAYNWIPGERRTMDELWVSFKSWASHNDIGTKIRSRKSLGRCIKSDLVTPGYLSLHRLGDSRGYILVNKPPYIEAGGQKAKLASVQLAKVTDILGDSSKPA
jgi:hypothetical protein